MDTVQNSIQRDRRIFKITRLAVYKAHAIPVMCAAGNLCNYKTAIEKVTGNTVKTTAM
jgi:hypothetical protein